MRLVVVVVLMELEVDVEVANSPAAMYHCRWLYRPAGERTGGSSSAFGDHDLSFKIKIDRFTSGDPALSLTKM